MDESTNQSILDQLAAQRHREMVTNETTYNSEEERAKAVAAASYPFKGVLKITMPYPSAAQISGDLLLVNGQKLNVLGTVQGLGFTGEITLPYISGYFSTDPGSLTGTILTLVVKQITRSPQMEIDIYSDSYAPVGLIVTSATKLVPFGQLFGSMALQTA